MCMTQGMAQPMNLTNSSGQSFHSPTGIIGAKMAENPGQVAKFRAENKLGSMFGYDPYMTKLVAKTEGREWDASDPYGLNPKPTPAATQGSTAVTTISTAQAATQQPSTNTRTPQRVRPIRSSLKTTSGVKQIPTASSLSGGMGLNVPN